MNSITRIHIFGFRPVLCVSDGKKIQNWKNGLRSQVIMESSRLRSLATERFTLKTFLPSQAIVGSNEPEVSPNALPITWPPSLENYHGYLSSLEAQANEQDGEISVSDSWFAVEKPEIK
jgi:hypothetical protein